nr:MAG TPA: hypothetical protein [Caudoviricetes sp.]
MSYYNYREIKSEFLFFIKKNDNFYREKGLSWCRA